MEAAGWAVEAAAVAAGEERRRSIGVGGAGGAGIVGAWGRRRRKDLGRGPGRRCRMDRWGGVVGRGNSLMLQAPGDRRRCSGGGAPFAVGEDRVCPG